MAQLARLKTTMFNSVSQHYTIQTITLTTCLELAYTSALLLGAVAKCMSCCEEIALWRKLFCCFCDQIDRPAVRKDLSVTRTSKNEQRV